MERRGLRATRVGVDGRGIVDPAAVEAALEPGTLLISVMHANNEVGTLQPVAELASRCRPRGVWLHSDAAQSVGKVPVNVDDLGVDLLSMSAHKFHGPKGIGALYIRKGTKFKPMVVGGHQEGGRRAGTENVPGIVGMG